MLHMIVHGRGPTALLLCSLLTLVASPAAMGTEVIDQENPVPVSENAITTYPTHDQSFTPSYDNVTGIAVCYRWITGPIEVNEIVIELLDGNCGSVVATGSTPVSAVGWQMVDFGGPIPVVPEQERLQAARPRPRQRRWCRAERTG